MPSDPLADKIQSLLPHLDERSRRLYLASEARTLGRGGIAKVARLSGCMRNTIAKGLQELESEPLAPEKIRRAGGGRTKLRDSDPGLVADLRKLVDDATRGDPMSPLLYTAKSTTNLADALKAKGHSVSADTVGRLLREEGFSLQANVKTLEGTQHPDRDAQFRHINRQVKAYQKAGQPIVSVDTKKKENVGNFKNNGREWHSKGEPPEANTYDFPDKELGKAIPYGVYDPARNEGWVNVGCDHDTAAFAVESLRIWWKNLGREAYPKAKKLLVCADGGGSNGSRVRLWKVELAKFAAETGLTVSVCHFPPGTSKWNKIEHRMFSHISINWRGRQLTSHQVIIDLIGATTTKKGLKVHASLDKGTYPKGIKVSDEELQAVPLRRHKFCGEWNYTITPPSPQN